MKRILTNPHCTAGTLGHHCTPGTLGFHHGTMGLTNQESATINQVAGQLNAASQMHKGQAQKLRNLGFTPNASNAINLVENYEPTNQEISWFRGKAKNLHNSLHANTSRRQMLGLGNSVSGKVVGTAITGAFIGNTLIARTLGTKWMDSLDVGFMTTGLASALAGGFTIANGIPEEDVTKLAAGGALMGLGLFYIGAGK